MNTKAKFVSRHADTSVTKSTYLYSWIIVIFSSLFLFYKYIMQVSPSIMTHQLMRAFHINGVGLGNLAATFFYTYFITQLFVGVLLDRLSPRFLSSAAILTSAVGTYYFATAHSLPLACLARALMGAGAAFATVSYMKLTANWFQPHKFAFVGGLLATAAMLGAIFGQAPLSSLVGMVGWRQALIICAWAGALVAILFFLLVRDTPKAPILQHAADSNQSVRLQDIATILKKKSNWVLTFYSGLAFTPVAVFGGLWGNPFIAQAYHLSTTQTASVISIIFFGLAAGGPILGYISDKLQVRRQVMLYGALFALLSITTVIYIHQLPIVVLSILLFVFGFATGAFMLGFTIGKEINPIAMSATVIALINTGDGIFGSFTEPMIGKLLDLGWTGVIKDHAHFFSTADYRHAFLIIPLYLIVALILARSIKERESS